MSPTSPKEYDFYRCEIKHVRAFIEEHHYSKNVNGLDVRYCFCLTYNNSLVGGMIYGRLAMRNAYKKYAREEEDVIELRRLCCIDDTPKNTESFFIAKSIQYLTKRTTLKRIVSYADPTFGHEGTIYKASNFQYQGDTAKGKVILYKGKRYHDKAVRTKYNGTLKPFAVELLRALETGEAEYICTESKRVYVYNLPTRKRPKRINQIKLFNDGTTI
jgi:hypothetical protein